MKWAVAYALVAALSSIALVLTAQEQRLTVKGHQLGETAAQFFAEGFEKLALSACADGDFRSINKSSKRDLKKYCNDLAAARQQAASGKRYEDTGGGDLTELRRDTFTFEGGRLVKVEMIYSTPSAEENYRGQSFDQIFQGIKGVYGSPTSENTESVHNAYGVPYVAHRELWLRPQDAILIVEKPGEGGSTTLSAFTRAEYDRAFAAGTPKTANPLQ